MEIIPHSVFFDQNIIELNSTAPDNATVTAIILISKKDNWILKYNIFDVLVSVKDKYGHKDQLVAFFRSKISLKYLNKLCKNG